LTLLIFHRPSPSRHPPPFPTPRSSDLQGPALRHSQRADPFAHQAFQPVIFLRHGQNVMPSSQGAVASPWKPAMTGTRSERDQDMPAATAARETDSLPDRIVDVVVIGGGAAGLNGALMLARSRRSVVVIDSGTPRNAPAEAMHGFIVLDGTPPGEILERGRAQVRDYGGRVVPGEVVSAAPAPPSPTGDVRFTIALADGRTITARRVLVATGLRDVLPEVPGLAEHWGRSVVHCPYCHGWEVRDEPIGVLATTSMSVHQALLFRQL